MDQHFPDDASHEPHQPPEPVPDEHDAEPADPRWTALARELAGESDPDDATRAWLDADPQEAGVVSALDRSLLRLTFAAPDDLDVEAALQRVKARRNSESATPITAPQPASGARVLEFRPARPTMPVRTATPARTMWRVAAAAVALVGGAAIVRAVQHRDVPAQHFATTVGQRDSVHLADGTRIVLGPGSSLDVAAGYGRARREITLRGEAFVEVQHDAAKPFVVRTGAATIEDVGTAFVVRDGSDGRVSIAVTQGTVRVQSVQAATSAPSTTGFVMHAGDRSTVVPGRAPAPMARLADVDATAWTQGRLVFQDTPLPEVAAELQRWYGISLRADSSLAERHLTAAFQGESVADALRIIGLALGVTIEQRGDTAIVHAPGR